MCGIAGILSSDIDLRGEKLLVEKMGGTIWLEKSELNKGSEFIFTIPLFNKKI